MSSTDRQNRLLVAEDWRKIYQSFRNADFQSYDFENLRRVMIDYLRQNYPEDFNDYIESSEYLALIDMIAFLGQSYAYRVDLNARENFLELAERRESVLRLARTLSYNAKRNQAGNGLLKWQSITTSQSILDGNGRNLAGQEILWNDPSNNQWFDQFIRVLNAAMPISAQFGTPNNKGIIYNIPTEQYTIQTTNNTIPVYSFNKTIDSRAMSFEITSTIIKDNQDIAEDPPLGGKNLSFIYRDDGKGSASPANGFFSHFRQGTLQTGTFSIPQPSNNEIIDIDSNNINDTDVWLYKLDSRGVESEYWIAVPNFEANNVIYNSLNKKIRNIYNIITRVDDRISIAFSDGLFGNLPLGSFRIYYRVSNGLNYTINPRDMRSVNLEIPYISNTGQIELLSISMNLQTSVSNSASTESNQQIKQKAPGTYYTQNRMITAEDYNLSPLAVNQDVLKVKSVNRTSSGISRYFDLTDPTGKYSNINLFSDDGVAYKEEYEDIFKFSYNTTVEIEGIINNKILDSLRDIGLRNFFYDKFSRISIGADLIYKWNKVTVSVNESTGYLTDASNSKVGYDVTTILKNLEIGTILKFVAPSGKYFIKDSNNDLITTSENTPNATTYLWAKIISISNNGINLLNDGSGPVKITTEIPTGAILDQIIPQWTTNLSSSIITTMVNLIFTNKPFGLRYDLTEKSWKIVFENDLNLISNFNIGKAGDNTNQRLDASWLLLFTTDTEVYTVKYRKLRYVFESDKKIRFYLDNTKKIFDVKSGIVVKDKIKILGINNKPNTTNFFTYDLDWQIHNEFVGTDGYVDTKKLEITFNDSNDDGIVDDPDIFDILTVPSYSIWNSNTTYSKGSFVLYSNRIYESLVNDNFNNEPLIKNGVNLALNNFYWRINYGNYVILEKYETSTGITDYRYIPNNNIVKIVGLESDGLYDYNRLGLTKDQYYYFSDTNLLAKRSYNESRWIYNLDYKVFIGRSNLKFQYIHNADYESRIDPGHVNIMDIYVLSRNYDIEYRRWIAGAIENEPLPPSSDQLSLIMAPMLNPIKAMSDEIIYHPTRYKILFGIRANPNLRASFKVIKNLDQTLSDNEVRARVLAAINEFFVIENWDFGDTFYFSELVAYIMNRTAPYILNIVIVPRQANLNFGSLFEIKSESDEVFINGATTEDIEIVDSLTSSNLSARGSINTTTNIVSRQNITSSQGRY
ncbi:MAG: hypothetical protein EBT86_00680 [Actinobacteria bacterium]|nr:hypothetical protein [Actinomycetota bacterium]